MRKSDAVLDSCELSFIAFSCHAKKFSSNRFIKRGCFSLFSPLFNAHSFRLVIPKVGITDPLGSVEISKDVALKQKEQFFVFFFGNSI